MKKIIVIFLQLFLFFSFQGVSAQGVDNSFQCEYDFATGNCTVNNGSIRCDPGFEADSSFCSQFTGDSSSCDGAPSTCVEIEFDLPPESTCYIPSGSFTCQITTGCEGGLTFDTNEACVQYLQENTGSPPQGLYKCISTNGTCRACTDTELLNDDPRCSFSSLAQCSSNCSVPELPGSDDGGGGSGILGGGSCGSEDINTAIGCIPISNTNALFGFVLRWALGIAGGIALVLIVVAGFIITTSQGDPRRLQGGKELLVSAIAGLVMIIFAIFILRIIGVDILGVLS